MPQLFRDQGQLVWDYQNLALQDLWLDVGGLSMFGWSYPEVLLFVEHTFVVLIMIVFMIKIIISLWYD